MKEAIMKVIGSLALAGSLFATSPAEAARGGWLFPQPHPTYPQFVWGVTDTNGSQWITFDAGLDWWGSGLYPTSAFGSYDNYMEVYCQGWGWWDSDSNSGVSGLAAGTIELECDWWNGQTGAASFYYVDT